VFSNWLANGAPSPCAFCEQTTCLGALYWNRSGLLQEAIALLGGGTLYSFQFQDAGMPPSWTAWSQGTRLFVAFTGTVNFPQIYGDVIGSFATDYEGLGCQAHSVFFSVWKDLAPTVLASFPQGWQTWEINLFGHSMGGSIAFLASQDLARQAPTATVNVWTIAAPKALTAGLQGGLRTAITLRTDFPGDAVPFLPPNGLVSVLRATNPAFWGIPIGWTHYGSGFTIDANGTPTIQPNSYWDTLPGPDALQSAVYSHRMATYMHAAEIAYSLKCPSQLSELLALSQVIRTLAFVQTGNWNVNPSSFVDIPWQNANAFLQPPPGPLTQGNLPLLGTSGGNSVSVTSPPPILPLATEGVLMPAKVSFFYNIGPLQGVSESWFSPAASAVHVTLNQLAQFITARMGISGTSTFLSYVRISTPTPPLTNRRLVQIFYPADIVNAPGAGGVPIQGQYAYPVHADEGSNDPYSALLTRRVNGTNYSLGYLRGLPDALDVGGGQIIPALPANWVIGFNTYMNLVKNLGWGWAQSIPTVNTFCSLVTAAAQADGTAILTFSPSPKTGQSLFAASAPFNAPDLLSRVQLRLSGQVLPYGFNGVYTVQVLSLNSCRTIRPLNVATFVAGTGIGTIYFKGLLPVLSWQIEKYVSRRSGAPFGRSRGRRKNRING
jgi:hypothetical protein